MWCNWNCEKGRDLYTISPCGCVSHSPVERRKTTHINCLCLRESVCIFSSSYFFGTYSILNWYMQSTHSHTHPSHSQTLSFWILNFFHHLVVCLVSFFTQLVRTAPDWTINRPQVLRFSNEKEAKNISKSIKYVRLYRIKIYVCVRWEYYSLFSLPPLAFAFDLWQCDIGEIVIFTCNIKRKNGFTINGEWAERIATAINSKQPTKIRSKSINVIYQYTHLQTAEGEKRKFQTKYRAHNSLSFFCGITTFLKTFSFLSKQTQVMQEIHTEKDSK